MSLVLVKQIETTVETARVHRRAHAWKITRADVSGIIYRFTDHPRPLKLFDDMKYDPVDGIDASASRKEGEMRAENKDLRGVVSLDANLIGEAVLRARQLRNARVDEYLVDWGFPWRPAIEHQVYFIRDITWETDFFIAEATGLVDWLDQPCGELWGPDCRVELFSQGNGKCNLSETGFLLSADVNTVGTDDRVDLTFTVPSTGIWAADDYGKDGKLVWVSGDNNGVVSIMKSYDHIPSFDAEVELQEPLPFAIQTGDMAILRPGCNKQPGVFDSTGHCKNKFGNLINFQGEFNTPGDDRAQAGVPFQGA